MLVKKYNEDIGKDNHAVGKLRTEAERAKSALNNQHQVCVEIESLFDGSDFSEPPTRAMFEELNHNLFLKAIGPVKKAIEDVGLEKNQIHQTVSCWWLHQDSQGPASSSRTTSTQGLKQGRETLGSILSGEGGDEIKVFLFLFRKRALSNHHQVHVEIESLFDGSDFSKLPTPGKFAELDNEFIRKNMGPMKKAMDDTGLEKRQIHELFLAGGTTRIPKVQ
ncbi:heat shock 70 kDa protein BIP1-like [Aegilops tauschii subsp. strangulata]|uniref:Luminal-binding protein 2 n=1 Tax=Aegilops tauschii TaxID=37682 RepID=M8BUZ7_AEGTA